MDGSVLGVDGQIHRHGRRARRDAPDQGGHRPTRKGRTVLRPPVRNFGPAVRLPVLRPATERAVQTLWRVSARETGVPLTIRHADSEGCLSGGTRLVTVSGEDDADRAHRAARLLGTSVGTLLKQIQVALGAGAVQFADPELAAVAVLATCMPCWLTGGPRVAPRVGVAVVVEDLQHIAGEPVDVEIDPEVNAQPGRTRDPTPTLVRAARQLGTSPPAHQLRAERSRRAARTRRRPRPLARVHGRAAHSHLGSEPHRDHRAFASA